MSETIFTGYAKEKVFNNGGKIVSLSWKEEDLKELIGFINEAGYVNVDLKWSKAGKPYMAINTYGLDTSQPRGGEKAPMAQQGGAEEGQDDLPF